MIKIRVPSSEGLRKGHSMNAKKCNPNFTLYLSPGSIAVRSCSLVIIILSSSCFLHLGFIAKLKTKNMKQKHIRNRKITFIETYHFA